MLNVIGVMTASPPARRGLLSTAVPVNSVPSHQMWTLNSGGPLALKNGYPAGNVVGSRSKFHTHVIAVFPGGGSGGLTGTGPAISISNSKSPPAVFVIWTKI